MRELVKRAIEILQNEDLVGADDWIEDAEDELRKYTPSRRISDHDIFIGYQESEKSASFLGTFMRGVVFAEKKHGIT